MTWWEKFKARSWLFHLGLISLFLLVVFLLFLAWLKIYTNHGQKLSLPNYEEQPLVEVRKDAKQKSFDIVVTDSIHDLDYSGGIILKQNPSPNATVKEGRKIYVTVSKYQPDLIPLNDLPRLYGNIYTSMRDLIEGFGIKTNIQDYRFDTGPENSILEVMYKGEVIINREGKKPNFNIEKGGTLDFILAKSSGGITNVPNLRCLEYAAAEFLADSYRLILEVEEEEVQVENIESAYVIKQIPPYDPEAKLMMNDKIKVFLSSVKPADCADGFVPENQN